MGLITFINVAIGVSLGGLLYTIWPEHYFSWYPSIPFFYWVMAMAMTFFLDRVKRKNGDVTVTMYMLVRLCKFTLFMDVRSVCRATIKDIWFHVDVILFHLPRTGDLHFISV